MLHEHRTTFTDGDACEFQEATKKDIGHKCKILRQLSDQNDRITIYLPNASGKKTYEQSRFLR